MAASSGWKVVVLCPNGRRQNVKVTPNSSILEILEEACKKQGFNPTDYDVRHYNKRLDLSLTVCFANLPNNTLLELKPAEKIRSESEITVALQLESGERIVSDFPPSSSLQDIIRSHLLSNNLPGEPVCVYMRQQFTGDQLKNTTLRSLGLTGGKTIIRLIFRPLETLSSQAHVSAPLPKPQVPEPDEGPTHSSQNYAYPESNVHNTIKQPRLELYYENNEEKVTFRNHSQFVEDAKESSDSTIFGRKKAVSGQKLHETSNECMQIGENELSKNTTMTSQQNFHSQRTECESDSETMDFENTDVVEEEVGEIKFLGPRNAVLFNLKDIAEVKKEDFPADFFDLTIKDIRYLVADYKRIREELETEPLMLKSQREARILQQYTRYKQAVIRIYFPDMLVLQGSFIAEETIQSVKSFIRQYLQNPEKDFYLYVTPPKTKLSPEKSLIEARLVPAAVVYFGSDEPFDTYLHSNYRTQVSDPRAVWKIAEKYRQKCEQGPLDNYIKSGNSTVANRYDDDIVIEQPVEQTDILPAQRPITSQGARPKWFKLGNK